MANNPALRAAAEFQADLYIECYAQALRVREAMQDIDAQDDDDKGDAKADEEPAGDDLPSVDDEGAVIDAEAEIVFQIASELYAGSREMLLKSIVVAPAATPAPPAPPASPAPEPTGRRRLTMGDGRGG